MDDLILNQLVLNTLVSSVFALKSMFSFPPMSYFFPSCVFNPPYQSSFFHMSQPVYHGRTVQPTFFFAIILVLCICCEMMESVSLLLQYSSFSSSRNFSSPPLPSQSFLFDGRNHREERLQEVTVFVLREINLTP